MHTDTDGAASPAILAPAGNKAAFLAALAAGADAIYCGLRSFSARMEAKNFSLEELAALTRLAHDRGTRVYVTLNSLVRPEDLESVARTVKNLEQWVKPDALIIQDLALISLARQVGFAGELHLSTLANVTFPAAMNLIRKGIDANITRVVLPRELSVDEIKAIAKSCPEGLDLEVFIHGALCYGVSGRCYWSSYLGGKSGLRGRCVQPCRRLYSQGKGVPGRFFSCQDLSLDVLVKVLLSIPQVKVWKIEGRKKGPHYVFYTVQAYRMLRDHGTDPQMKKAALGLLDRALGRTGTHYNFLSQRPQNPVNTGGQTGSGLLMGTVKGGRGNAYLVPREELLPGDVLRIGYEDAPGHSIYRVSRAVPKKGRLHLTPKSRRAPSKGTPVFLTDRREKALNDMIAGLEEALSHIRIPPIASAEVSIRLPKGLRKKTVPVPDIRVDRTVTRKKSGGSIGLWLSDSTLKAVSKAQVSEIWWWLPPVIWPDEQSRWASLVSLCLRKEGRRFVLNMPWQMAFFRKPEGLNLWAGPFCNLANPLALASVAALGFSGAVVSPELGRDDYLQLPKHSPLPLGIVISGHWPLCISRVLPEGLAQNQPFTSPRGEQAWIRQYGPDTWVWPNWQLDIEARKSELQKAGYQFFIRLTEPIPPDVMLKKRPGLWNWSLTLS